MKGTAVAVLALALAGCGSEKTPVAGSTGASSGGALEISETEFALDPPSLTVDGQGKVTIRAVNDGKTTHALELEGAGVEEKTGSLAPGESGELTVTLKPGTYEIYCPIGNHRSLGMEGTVVVGAAGSAGTPSTRTGEEPATTGDDQSSGYG